MHAITRRQLLTTGALGFGALALAGCTGQTTTKAGTGSSNNGKPVVLTAWTWSAAADINRVFNAVKEAYPKEFKNVTLKVETIGTGDTDVAQKLNLALSSHGTLPDFVKLLHPEIAPFASAGAFADFGEFVSKDTADDLYTGALESMKYGGKYYGVPREVQGKVFWYRSDLFKEAGIDVATIASMDDFIAAGRKLTAKFPGRHIINVGDKQGGEDTFDEVASAYPDLKFDEGNYSFKNPGTAAAFEFWRQLKASGIGFNANDFDNDWPPAIKAEKICGFLSASWMTSFIPGYATVAQSRKWAAALWPSFEPDFKDQSFGGDLGSDVFSVLEDSPNRDIALKFLALARLDEKGSQAAFQGASWIPQRRSLGDWTVQQVEKAERPEGMSDADWALQPQNYFDADAYRTSFKSFENVRVVDYGPNFINEMTILGPWMDKAVNGKMTTAAAVDGMRKDLRSQIK